MKFQTLSTLSLSAALLAAGTIQGCGESPSASNATDQSDAQARTKPWMLDTPPSSPVSIIDAKASAQEGDRIVLRGIIGGSLDAITSESPAIRIIDTSVHNECVSDDDHCETPWDYCCASPTQLKAGQATALLVGPDGQPIDDDLLASGLDPLDTVLIVGTVGPRPSGDVLTVMATGVYPEPR